MTKKIKILIAAGGTGGHVFPAFSLYNSFSEKKYNVELITDSRGYGFLKEYKNIKMSINICEEDFHWKWLLNWHICDIRHNQKYFLNSVNGR